jgi:hypothetical protein
MSGLQPSARWRFLISPRWLTWHAFAVLTGLGMLALGYWQFHRAETGNTLSWAYTFEWPIFTVFVLVFWIKTIIDEYRRPGGTASGQAGPAGDSLELPASAWTGAGPGDAGPGDGSDSDDPELAAYNAYLASLNRQRPAG